MRPCGWSGIVLMLASALPVALAAAVLIAARTAEDVRTLPAIAAVSFPALALLALGAVSVLLLAASTAVPGLRSRLSVSTTAATAGVLVAALATVSVGTPVPVAPDRTDPATGIRVVAWNVSQLQGPPDAVVALMHDTGADLGVFPELSASNLQGGGGGRQVLGARSIAVTALIPSRLGKYRVTAEDDSGAVSGWAAEPVDAASSAPRIVAVHLSRPTLTGGARGWTTGLDWVARQCARGATVAVGDFNAVPAASAPGSDAAGCRLGRGRRPGRPPCHRRSGRPSTT